MVAIMFEIVCARSVLKVCIRACGRNCTKYETCACPFKICNHLGEERRAGPDVIKLFSCLTQLSTKFQLLCSAELSMKKVL